MGSDHNQLTSNSKIDKRRDDMDVDRDDVDEKDMAGNKKDKSDKDVDDEVDESRG